MNLFETNVYKNALQRSLAEEYLIDEFYKTSKRTFGDRDVKLSANMLFGNLSSFSNAGNLSMLLENSIVNIGEFKIEGDFNTLLKDSNIFVQHMTQIIKEIVETRTIEVEKIKEVSRIFIDLAREDDEIKKGISTKKRTLKNENKSLQNQLFLKKRKYVMIYNNGVETMSYNFNKNHQMGQFIFNNKIHLNFTKPSSKNRILSNIINGEKSFSGGIFNANSVYDLFISDTLPRQFLILLNMDRMKTNFLSDTIIKGNNLLNYLFENTDKEFNENVRRKLQDEGPSYTASNYKFDELLKPKIKQSQPKDPLNLRPIKIEKPASPRQIDIGGPPPIGYIPSGVGDIGGAAPPPPPPPPLLIKRTKEEIENEKIENMKKLTTTQINELELKLKTYQDNYDNLYPLWKSNVDNALNPNYEPIGFNDSLFRQSRDYLKNGKGNDEKLLRTLKLKLEELNKGNYNFKERPVLEEGPTKIDLNALKNIAMKFIKKRDSTPIEILKTPTKEKVNPFFGNLKPAPTKKPLKDIGLTREFKDSKDFNKSTKNLKDIIKSDILLTEGEQLKVQSPINRDLLFKRIKFEIKYVPEIVEDYSHRNLFERDLNGLKADIGLYFDLVRQKIPANDIKQSIVKILNKFRTIEVFDAVTSKFKNNIYQDDIFINKIIDELNVLIKKFKINYI